MKKLILITLIFSYQYLQSQVIIEKAWSKYFDNTIFSFTNSLNDSSLLVSCIKYRVPLFTLVNKLDSYDTNKLEDIKSYGYHRVFFNNENKPFMALSSSLQSACYLIPINNYDSLNCFNKNFAVNGSISYKNMSITIQSGYYNQDSILHFSIHSITDKNNYKTINLKMPRDRFMKPSVSYSSRYKYYIIYSVSYRYVGNLVLTIPVIEIFNESGMLITTIDDVLENFYYLNPVDLNTVFHLFDNDKYIIYFTKNGLTKFDLQTFEKTELIIKPINQFKYSVLSPNEKFILVSVNDSLTYIDLTTLEMTLLSKDSFLSLAISNSNNYFYGVKNVENGTLYKYRIKTPTSINEDENESNLLISPNPTNDFINIAGIEPETLLELTNILGETVWSGIGTKQISTQTTPNGTYFLKTTKDNQIKSQKVLVWR